MTYLEKKEQKLRQNFVKDGTIDGVYTVGSQYGKGGTSKVRLGFNEEGEMFAFKIPHRVSRSGKQLLQTEYDLGKDLDHPHILKVLDINLKGIFEDEDNAFGPVSQSPYIMMEPMLGGELLDVVINTGKFEAKYARAIFKQLCDAVNYMHIEKGVAHRDLKLDNIMIGKGNVIKIIDQGFVCPVEGERGTGFSTDFKGTMGYSCPEKLRKGNCFYSPVQDDLFALAVILFSLHTGVPPVTEKATEDDATYKYVCSGRMNHYWSLY